MRGRLRSNMLLGNTIWHRTNFSFSSLQTVSPFSPSLEHADIIEKKLIFLEEQFDLVFSRKTGFSYSVNMILFTFIINTQSPACYKALNTAFLTSPHPKYLKRISSEFAIGANSEEETGNFLKAMRAQLSDREAFVVLQIDEVYLNAKMEYKSKVLVGVAENDPLSNAKTAQVFLISSLFGHFEQVIRIYPVLNSDGKLLYELTLPVVKLL